MISIMNRLKQKNYKKIVTVLVFLFGAFLIGIHFIRIFDNNFWGDEYYSIHLAGLPFKEMLIRTAHDTHPPFFLIVLKIFTAIIGKYGWVYHLASVMPFTFMIVACATIVRKDFGDCAAVLCMSMSATFYQAIHFIVEVRDYQWAAFWLLLAFIYLRRIISYDKYTDTIKIESAKFVIFSLMAGFSNYFCIIALIAIYTSLMLYSIKNKAILKNTIVIWIVTFVVYLPWAVVFIMTFSENTGKYFKAGNTSFLSCVKYLFDSRFTIIYLLAFIVSSSILIVKSKELEYKVWLLIGIITILFTIALPIFIAHIKTPFLFLRHLYPICPIAWILLATNVTKFRYKRLIFVIMLVLMIPFGIKGIINVIDEENIVNSRLDEFLAATSEIQGSDNCIIVSNEDIISPGLADYYYPQIPNYWYSGDEEENKLIIDGAKDVIWLLDAVDRDNSNEMLIFIKENGYRCECVIENGFFGNYIASAWKCIKE